MKHFIFRFRRAKRLLSCSLHRKHSKLFNILIFMMYFFVFRVLPSVVAARRNNSLLQFYNGNYLLVAFCYRTRRHAHAASTPSTPSPSPNVLFSLNLLYLIKRYTASIRFILDSIVRVRDTIELVECVHSVWTVECG